MFTPWLWRVLRKVGLISEGHFVLDSHDRTDPSGLVWLSRMTCQGQVTELKYVKYPSYVSLMDASHQHYIMALFFPDNVDPYLGQTVTYVRYARLFIRYQMGDYSGIGLGLIQPNDVLIATAILIVILSGWGLVTKP